MTLTIPTPSAVHGISQVRHLRLLRKAVESVLEDLPLMMEAGWTVDLNELVQDRLLEQELLISQHHDRRREE